MPLAMLERFREEMPQWVSAVVAIMAEVLLAAALLLTYILDDKDNRLILIGAIITNSTTVINFLFGSSKSGQRKDETISAFGSALAQSTPGTPLPPMQPVPPPQSVAETAADNQERREDEAAGTTLPGKT